MQAFIDRLVSSEYGMAVPYGGKGDGYVAYVSEDYEQGGYFITYCKDELPPHDQGHADTAEEAARILAEVADLSGAYEIEPDE